MVPGVGTREPGATILVAAAPPAPPHAPTREEAPLVRSTLLGPVATAVVLALGACDRAPDVVIVPEFEFAFSFEGGLADWSTASADLGSGTGSVTASQERASRGSGSARLALANPGGAGKLWLTRALDVTPDQRYAVELSFDLGTSDHGSVTPWSLVAMVRPAAPSGAASLEFAGETSSGVETAGGAVWAEKSLTLTAQADKEGRLYLTLGVWGTTTGTRTYWLDNVRVVLTRI